jgi:hypothetical protein
MSERGRGARRDRSRNFYARDNDARDNDRRRFGNNECDRKPPIGAQRETKNAADVRGPIVVDPTERDPPFWIDRYVPEYVSGYVPAHDSRDSFFSSDASFRERQRRNEKNDDVTEEQENVNLRGASRSPPDRQKILAHLVMIVPSELATASRIVEVQNFTECCEGTIWHVLERNIANSFSDWSSLSSIDRNSKRSATVVENIDRFDFKRRKTANDIGEGRDVRRSSEKRAYDPSFKVSVILPTKPPRKLDRSRRSQM